LFCYLIAVDDMKQILSDAASAAELTSLIQMPAKKVYCEHGAITPLLRALQKNGVIELIHFPYDPNSRSRRLSLCRLPSDAQWRDANLTWEQASGLAWDDFAKSDKLNSIVAIVGKDNRRDCLHLDSAFRSKCVCFLTEDTDIVGKSQPLTELLGMPIFSPRTDVAAIQSFLEL
jgi:hypothetical protein